MMMYMLARVVLKETEKKKYVEKNLLWFSKIVLRARLAVASGSRTARRYPAFRVYGEDVHSENPTARQQFKNLHPTSA